MKSVNYTNILVAVFICALALISACSEQNVNTFAEKPVDYDSAAYQVSSIKSRVVTSQEAFAQTLHPLLVQNCSSCHSTQGAVAPLIADSDPAIAYNDLTSITKINLALPANARVVVKLKLDQHNCWSSNCSADGRILQNAIVDWGSLVTTEAVGGQASYDLLCANCHGLDGLGSTTTMGVTRPIALADLTTLIDATMPPADPASCVGNCAAETASYIVNTFSNANEAIVSEPLTGFPTGPVQKDILCGRLAAINAQNNVRDVFCGPTSPAIASLRDLQSALGLAFVNRNAIGQGNNGRLGNPAFTLVGHSSSLVARLTTTINPRALIFTPPTGAQTPGLTVMGYVRGDQFVELVTSDRVTNELQFFLVTFKQQCSVTHSCTPGDLLTPAVESNWIEYNVYSQDDLKNTVLDCLHCHQPSGPGTRSILRMQELQDPWTHFFRNDTRGGRALLADYTAAHGTVEDYAGIPGPMIDSSDPALLEDLIRDNGFGNQPNEFISDVIENQVRQTPGQPQVNDPPGSSLEWQRIYNNTVLGQFISVPYHDVKITDATKLANMTQAYQSFLNGTLAAANLPDIRDVLLDVGLRDMGFKVMAGLDGQQIITQACSQCHNSALDQTISRARFNVDLNNMSDTQGGVLTGAARDAEIAVAIGRLRLTSEDVRKMPPELFKTLDPAEIDAAASYLCSQMTVPGPQCANLAAFTPNPAPLPPAAGARPGRGNNDD